MAANQEYAQAVDHVGSRLSLLTQLHMHVVPAPNVDAPTMLGKWNDSSKSPLSFIGRRGELTDEEGEQVASALRAPMPRMSHL